MATGAARLLDELERLRARFDPAAARRKTELVAALARLRLGRAAPLLRLHEALLFLRAFPDSRGVLEAAEAALAAIPGRVAALAPAEREELEGSGVAGSAVTCSWSLPVARWLVARDPAAVSLYREAEGLSERLLEALPRLVLPAEAETLEDGYVPALEWLRGGRAAPAAAGSDPALARLLAIVEALPVDDEQRHALWGALDVPLVWELGGGSSSRTLARAPRGEPAWQERPLDRSARRLEEAVERPAPPLAPVSRREAERWIELCRSAVTARLREVHTFSHASADDVSVADCGAGLVVVVVGVTPPARHALRSFHGYLLVKNGVPVGYGDAVLLFGWGELNFHVFESFRQGESSRTYAEVARLFRHRFGVEWLFLNRYQFGWRNEEAIRTGAFWFYEKLGFRPRGRERAALWREERRRLRRDPAHRSTPPTLRRLSRGHMGIALGPRAGEARRRYARFHPLALGRAVTRAVETRHGGDRAAAARASTARLRRLLGREWPAGEAGRALERMAPVLDLLPGLEVWGPAERLGLVELARAKAGRRERDYLLATQRALRLRDELLPLGRLGGAAGEGPRTARR